MCRTKEATKTDSPATFAPGRRKRHGKMLVRDQGGSKDVKGTGVLHAAERERSAAETFAPLAPGRNVPLLMRCIHWESG